MTFRFYLVADDGEVTGTDSLEVALVAKRDGVTLVIEPNAGEATFDSAMEPIKAVDESDWLDDAEDAEDDDA